MFGLFKRKEKKDEVEPQFIVATINARLQPMHRGEIYEDPLDEILTKHSVGEVSGGGTLQSKSGEIECCDIEIQVGDSSDETVEMIKSALKEMGVPKGSKIQVESTGSEFEFGSLEGLAIYLNGTDLDAEVYAASDSNHVKLSLPSRPNPQSV